MVEQSHLSKPGRRPYYRTTYLPKQSLYSRRPTGHWLLPILIPITSPCGDQNTFSSRLLIQLHIPLLYTQTSRTPLCTYHPLTSNFILHPLMDYSTTTALTTTLTISPEATHLRKHSSAQGISRTLFGETLFSTLQHMEAQRSA